MKMLFTLLLLLASSPAMAEYVICTNTTSEIYKMDIIQSSNNETQWTVRFMNKEGMGASNTVHFVDRGGGQNVFSFWAGMNENAILKLIRISKKEDGVYNITVSGYDYAKSTAIAPYEEYVCY